MLLSKKDILDGLIESDWQSWVDECDDNLDIEYLNYEGLTIDLYNHDKYREFYNDGIWNLSFHVNLIWLDTIYKKHKLPKSFMSLDVGQQAVNDFLIRIKKLMIFS